MTYRHRDRHPPQHPVDTWPLRVRDPVSVDGYRLVSRLGAGGMADVFYALAPTGGPVAVRLLRAADGAAEACRREYWLASTVDPDCAAPALGHGVSAAGACYAYYCAAMHRGTVRGNRLFMFRDQAAGNPPRRVAPFRDVGPLARRASWASSPGSCSVR